MENTNYLASERHRTGVDCRFIGVKSNDYLSIEFDETPIHWTIAFQFNCWVFELNIILHSNLILWIDSSFDEFTKRTANQNLENIKFWIFSRIMRFNFFFSILRLKSQMTLFILYLFNGSYQLIVFDCIRSLIPSKTT